MDFAAKFMDSPAGVLILNEWTKMLKMENGPKLMMMNMSMMMDNISEAEEANKTLEDKILQDSKENDNL